MSNELTDVRCPCGDEFPADSYDAGFIAGAGMCQNCDAAMPPKDIPAPVEQAGGDERAALAHRSEFHQHLKECADEVATWPSYKREALTQPSPLQAEQAEAERPEGPTEDELEAAGIGYPLHKEEAVKLWYSGFRSEVITVLEAWEAIGHDTGINPDKEELLDSLRYMLEKCEAHDAALARAAELEKELAMTRDAASKGDAARHAAGGMEMEIQELKAKLAEQAQHSAPEVFGLERYRVERTGQGFWPYCVRAGDGTRELFVGHLKQCKRVAAQLATAFEDGKFIARLPTVQAQHSVPELLEWAVGRWHAEVSLRPLINVHRRALDDTWRQVIRRLGGDTGLLCGPSHDELLAAAPGKEVGHE
ncbi:hypothetical protein I5M01_29390 [Pseudomonas aeruginosa]|nr:hypothetical protein [Pseudomonas aeruginosa]